MLSKSSQGFIFCVLLLGSFVSSASAERFIPPTPAFSSINGTGGNVTATRYNENLELINGTGISFVFDNVNKTLTIAGTIASSPLDLYCTLGDFLNSYNATTKTFTCGTPTSSGGQNNTMSSPTMAYSLVLPKIGVDLPIKGIGCNGSITCSSNSTDITISSSVVSNNLKVNNQTSQRDYQITGINNVTGVITTKQFSVNSLTCSAGQFLNQITNSTGFTSCATPTTGTIPKIFNQTSQRDYQITGINNVTGVITTKQFSVNTKACSGTDKVSSIDNATGNVICTTDSSSGTARESLVAYWQTDKTWANIGIAFVNVYTTGLGDPVRIDTNGKTTATIYIDWTKVGAGTQKCAIVDTASSSNILIMHTNLVSGANTNATVNIPAGLLNTIKTYKPRCLSSTSTDDPVWLSGEVLLR